MACNFNFLEFNYHSCKTTFSVQLCYKYPCQKASSLWCIPFRHTKKLVVGLNLLKHLGSHFNYSFWILMFHKVSYQGEFSMLRKEHQVLCPGLTGDCPCPPAQCRRPQVSHVVLPKKHHSRASLQFPTPCPAITIPRRFPAPSTGAVLVTCGCPAPVWVGGTGHGCQAPHLGRCYSLCHSSLQSYCRSTWNMPLNSSHMLC